MEQQQLEGEKDKVELERQRELEEQRQREEKEQAQKELEEQKQREQEDMQAEQKRFRNKVLTYSKILVLFLFFVLGFVMAFFEPSSAFPDPSRHHWILRDAAVAALVSLILLLCSGKVHVFIIITAFFSMVTGMGVAFGSRFMFEVGMYRNLNNIKFVMLYLLPGAIGLSFCLRLGI